MKYPARLFTAKILISSAILALTASSVQGVLIFQDNKVSAYLNGEQVYFAATLAVITSALAIPLLYLVWAKLHGTGRGVRMAGFISFIVAIAPMLSLKLTHKLLRGNTLHDTHYVNVYDSLLIGILGAIGLGLVLSLKGRQK